MFINVLDAHESLEGHGVSTMVSADVAQVILCLRDLGLGMKKISREIKVSRNTVRRYSRSGGWEPYKRTTRGGQLSGLESWLEAEFIKHHGNCDVLRQELKRQHGLDVHIRTIQRAVKPLRTRMVASALATVRFETPPGEQLQIDFGTKTIMIGDAPQKVCLFVATLGYSRRCYVRAFDGERQGSWFAGIEGALQHFGGMPRHLLIDNPTSMVHRHNRVTGDFRLNATFEEFLRYWTLSVIACQSSRARTKGKDERNVGYVKSNCIAGHTFSSWNALEEHIAWWMREVSDVHRHSTTNERPIDLYDRTERASLRTLPERPPFHTERHLVRVVHQDAHVGVDQNRYSVPWMHIGEQVQIIVSQDSVSISSGGNEIALHQRASGHRVTTSNPQHLDGILRRASRPVIQLPTGLVTPIYRSPKEYDIFSGGSW